MYTILVEDLDAAIAFGQANDTQYARRALVRAAFALIEGHSYQLRQVTLASLAKTGHLGHVELALLAEERHSLDEKGRPKVTEQFLRFPENVIFSMQSYAKNHGAEFVPDRSGAGWAAMRKAVDVRNRVTHPKSAELLLVSKADDASLTEAVAWWKATMLDLFRACDEADTYWRSKLASV